MAFARILDALLRDKREQADVWSCPWSTELRRAGLAARRWNLLHPNGKPRRGRAGRCPRRPAGRVIALAEPAEQGLVPAGLVADAITKYGIDPEKPDPTTV